MIVLHCNDCDNHPHICGKWRSQPTAEKLRQCIGGRWEEKVEKQVIKALLSEGHWSENGGASTRYELMSI